MSEEWFCVRSVTTDGSGHSITVTDVMPGSALRDTVESLSELYGGSAVRGRPGGWADRWTFGLRLSDGRRVTDMVIATPIV